jgi:hypothetical protein
MENALTVFMRTQRLRQFYNCFVFTKSSPNMPNVFKRAWRTRLKNINVFGEYAKSVLPYMENTPIDIKVSISTNFRPNSEKILVLNHLTGHDRMGKNHLTLLSL